MYALPSVAPLKRALMGINAHPRHPNKDIRPPSDCYDVFHWLKARINSLLDPRSFPQASTDWELINKCYHQSIAYGRSPISDLDPDDEMFWLEEEHRQACQGVSWYWELSALCLVLHQLEQWKTLRKIKKLMKNWMLTASDSPFNAKWGDVYNEASKLVDLDILKSLPPPFNRI